MRVIVIGCGRVGSGLVRGLSVDRHDLTVVDVDPRAFSRLGRGFEGHHLQGHALDRSVLEQAGIGGADALAAVTGNDEINAVVARLAVGRFRVPRVVARIYEPRQASLYRRLGVLTISPVEWGISRLAQLITMRNMAPVATLGGGRIHVVEATVSPNLAGRAAGELEVPGEARVVSVTRAGRSLLADRTTPLEAGDLVAIALVHGVEERLSQLLGME